MITISVDAVFVECLCPRCASVYHITPMQQRDTYHYRVVHVGDVDPSVHLPDRGTVSGDKPFCIFCAATLVAQRGMAQTANGSVIAVTERAGQG